MMSERREIQRRLLVDEIVADITNGVSKSDVLTKLQSGIYTYAVSPSMSQSSSYEWWNRAMDKFRLNNEASIAEKRDIMYSRYLNIYNESMEEGNKIAAKQTLDSMVKFFGIATPEKTEVTLKNITIDFGFDEDGED